MDSSSDEEEDDEPKSPARLDEHGRHRRRAGWHPKPYAGDPDGVGMEKFRYQYWKSPLWALFNNEATKVDGTREAKEFKAQFGVPRQIFDELVAEASEYKEIPSHSAGDGSGIKAPTTIPIKARLAATLWQHRGRALPRAAAFAACQEPDGLRRWQRLWTQCVVKYDYEKWVHPPETAEEIEDILGLHAHLGFPGCIGFTDGLAVEVHNIPWSRRNGHQGKTSGAHTRNFNVSGSARRMIHYVHGSHQGSDNDKTMARYDRYHQSIKNQTRYADTKFQLYTSDGVLATHTGVYIGTDNGYHPWRMYQYPSKEASSKDDAAWSGALERARKPGSECIFGILKKRFPSLTAKWTFGKGDWDQGVLFHDNTFKTLCMVHNRIQVHSGLHTLGSLPSDWRLANRRSDITRHQQAREEAAGLDATVGDCFQGTGDEEVQYEPGHDELHEKLVQHHAFARKRKEVFWLREARFSRNRRDTRPMEVGHVLHCEKHVYDSEASDREEEPEVGEEDEDEDEW